MCSSTRVRYGLGGALENIRDLYNDAKERTVLDTTAHVQPRSEQVDVRRLSTL